MNYADFLGMTRRPDTFSYAELKAATGDFNSSNKIGEGGFGHVYKVMKSITYLNSLWLTKMYRTSA